MKNKLFIIGLLLIVLISGCNSNSSTTQNQPKMTKGYAESTAVNYVYTEGYMKCCESEGCRGQPHEIKPTGSYFDGKNWVVSVDLFIKEDAYVGDIRQTFLITVNDATGDMSSNKPLTC